MLLKGIIVFGNHKLPRLKLIFTKYWFNHFLKFSHVSKAPSGVSFLWNNCKSKQRMFSVVWRCVICGSHSVTGTQSQLLRRLSQWVSPRHRHLQNNITKASMSAAPKKNNAEMSDNYIYRHLKWRPTRYVSDNEFPSRRTLTRKQNKYSVSIMTSVLSIQAIYRCGCFSEWNFVDHRTMI